MRQRIGQFDDTIILQWSQLSIILANLPGMYGITSAGEESHGSDSQPPWDVWNNGAGEREDRDACWPPWDVWNNDVAMDLIKKYLPCYNLEGIDYCQILHVLDYVEIGGDYDHNMHEFCYQMSANPFYSIFDMVYLGYKSLSSQSVHELVLKSV